MMRNVKTAGIGGLVAGIATSAFGIGGNVYIGPDNGIWSNPAHWSVGLAPVAGEMVMINNGGGAVTVLYTGGTGPFGGLTIDADDQLSIENGQQFRMAAGSTITNNGTISINDAGSFTYLRANSGQVTLNGTGDVLMSTNAIIDEVGSGSSIVNNGNLIHGLGFLGNNTLGITNNATISADTPGALVIDPPSGAAAMTNNGLLMAENGGLLSLGSATYENASGVIEADDASTVRLNSTTTFNGGTFNTNGSGEIEVVGTSVRLDGTVTPVTLDGNIVVRDGRQLTIAGQVSNEDVVTTESGLSFTYLRMSGPVTLDGGGTVLMSGDLSIVDEIGSGASLLNVDNVIEGSGSLGSNNLPITNQALVTANVLDETLTIDPPSGDDSFVNNGTLRAENGGSLSLGAGDFNNTNGVIEADAGSNILLASGTLIDGGLLQSNGDGVIQVQGTTTVVDGSNTTITTRGDVVIENGRQLRMSGTVMNEADIVVDSTISFTYARAVGPVELGGGGSIEMKAFSVLDEATSGSSLHNVDNVIHGEGSVGSNNLPIVNDGMLIADVDGGVMTVDPPSGLDTFVNNSTVTAENGGTMNLVAGDYQNQNGVIEATDGSIVRLNSGTTIKGGTLQTSGTGIVDVISTTALLDGTANAVDLSATTVVNNGAHLRSQGVIDNSGEILLDSSTSFTYFRVGGDVTLTGGGTIAMNVNSILDEFSSGSSLHNVDNIIRGQGGVGQNNLPILNDGEIRADVAGATLVIDPPSGADTFISTGVVAVENGANLTISAGSFETSGDFIVEAGSTASRSGDIVQSGGQSMIDGPLTMSTNSTFMLNAGVLSGNGSISGTNINVVNAGNVSPGSSAGTLTIGGDYTQDMLGDLSIELGGTAPGEFDVLDVTGSAFLSGNLSIKPINGFIPQIGDSFVILTTEVDGRFDEFLTAECGGQYQVTYTNSSVIITVVGEVIPADLNCDGSVNFNDLLILLGSWGPCDGCAADINDSGVVDFADIITLLGSWTS